MYKFYRVMSPLLLFILLGLFSCGGEPYSYQPERDKQAGPGLFSGEKGEIVLYESEKPAEPACRAIEKLATEQE